MSGMESFSLSDRIHAVLAPCLACLTPARRNADSEDEDAHNGRHGPGNIPRARSDELEGLLADADDDAETLSLHSNIGQEEGQGRKKRRARRAGKGIKLFGYDLFGRPAIQLPEDDDGEAAAMPRQRVRVRDRTISGSTVDSDAAPLDPAAIVRMADGAAVQQAAERAAKEERRRRRKERKMREAALALALERGHGNEFEGFPGSGNVISPTSLGPGTHSSGRSSSTNDEFGPFERAPLSPRFPQEAVDEDDAADFDGFAYAKTSRTVGGSASAGSGSDSRSRTSGSMSNVDPTATYYNHHFISKQPHYDKVASPFPAANGPVRKKKKRSQSSKHSSATTDSISTPPPYQTTFPAIAEQYGGPPPDMVVDRGSSIVPSHPAAGGFPSVGFGGGRPSRKNSEAGVFLASRGD